MIIDITYFQKQPLFVPNSIVQPNIGGNNPNNTEAIKSAIEVLEYQLLLACLGYSQHKELMEQFNPDGSLKDDAIDKWKYLVEGKELDNGRYWKGLRYTVVNTKNSLIAKYVFYNFLLDDQYYYSTTGIQRPNSENSTDVDADSKLVREWNRFVFEYQGNNFQYCLCNQILKTTEVSLFEFLSTYPDDYSTEFFRFYQLQNVWGV